MTGIEETLAVAGTEIAGSEIAETTAVGGLSVAGGISDLSGICAPETIVEAQKGLSAIFPNAFEQILNMVQRLIVHQTAGKLAGNNEALSLAARAASVYACGALNASPEKAVEYAKKFDSMDIGEAAKNAVEKLGKCDQVSPELAKAMAYAALMEIGKRSGSEAAPYALSIAFNSLYNAFSQTHLPEMHTEQTESPTEFKDVIDIKQEVDMLPRIKITDAVNVELVWNQFDKFSDRLDRSELSSAGIDLYDAWKKDIDMNFLQDCADDVSKKFGLPKLPVWRYDSNFCHWVGQDVMNPDDDVYGGDPELLKRFVEKTASVHREISPQIKAKILGTSLFAHESSHFMFSQCPLKFPPPVEELACDFMTRAYLIKSGIAPKNVINDLLESFFKTYNNPEHADNVRVFASDGTWLYPSTIERILIPEQTLGGFVGTFRDSAPSELLPGSPNFDIAKVGLLAARCMGVDLVLKPELGKFVLKDTPAKTGDASSNLTLAGQKIWIEEQQSFISEKLNDLKNWTSKVLSSAMKNRALMMSLVYYLKRYC